MPSWRLVPLMTVLFAVSTSLWWATSVWSLLPFGSAAFYRWSWLWMAAMLLSLLGIPVAALLAVFRRPRRMALSALGVCAAIVAGFGMGSQLGGRQRLMRLEGIPARAAPLVAAIQAFERDHRHPPGRLEVLVPDYIMAIPSTGFGGEGSWHYETPPYMRHPERSGIYGDNPWVVSLIVAGRPIPSYRLLYLPNRHYPSTATRIGEWARLDY